jgi:hypothetical protein
MLSVKWDKPSSVDPLIIEIGGSCIEPIKQQVEVDEGVLHLPPGSLREPDLNSQEMQPANVPRTDTAAPIPVKAQKKCKATVTVMRRRQGRVDPAYGQGGFITAAQIRQVTFNSIP